MIILCIAFTFLKAEQQFTFIPMFDNLIMYSSIEDPQTDPGTASNTNYSNSKNSVGIVHSYYTFYNYVSAASLIYFDVSNIVGKTVTSAYLNLYPMTLAGDPAGAAQRTDYKVNAIAAGWAPNSVTWNTAPSYFTEIEILFEVPFTAVVPTTIDVTSIVQKWANNIWINAGFIVQDAYYQKWNCNCYDSTDFAALGDDTSKIPQLVITIAEDVTPIDLKFMPSITNYLLMD